MELHKVQIEAKKRSHRKVGFNFFMEQGLGKTLTAGSEFADLVAERIATRMIVVCPNSFKGGWREDLTKHGYDFDWFIWEGDDHQNLRRWINKSFDKPPVIVVNWESIRPIVRRVKKRKFLDPNPLQQILFDFIAKKPTYIVFDESIKAKDPDSGQTNGAIMLADRCDYIRNLSGKPIAQGPHDLWGQMRITRATNMNYYAWKTTFCKMGGFKMKQVMGAQNEEYLASKIDPHVFQATKADWTDLPPKSYSIREYTLNPIIKQHYKNMHDDFVVWLSEESVVTVDQAITKYMKLQQIQCGWIYDEKGVPHALVPDEQNARLNALKEFISDELVGKACIAYHHKPVLAQLLRALGGEESVAWIKGGMTTAETDEQKRRFNEDPSVRFILLQDDASKYGHTLLGDQRSADRRYACSTMLIYENNYSLDTRSQIEDRIHRHGQIGEMASYIDFAGTPLDRDCIRALQRKESVFQAVFAPIRERNKLLQA